MKKTMSMVLSSAALALAVIGFMALPDTVTLPLGVNITLPKLVAVMIPAVLSLIGFVLGRDGENGGKSAVISVLGIISALFILTMGR